jgi:adenosylcobyric acid synthase
MTAPRTILVAGTASHVGKSTVAAGLCRLFADSGTTVAPFKAQNMSNEARAVLRPPSLGDPPSGEIGVAQTIQAQAAGVRATTDMNPVLLKPQGEGHSRLVLDGVATDAVAAGAYYEEHWHTARTHALAAFDRLTEEASVIVAEGAGSIAEMNLQHRDLANTELARHADAEIILVADIERGGVFAQVVGTLELMPKDLRRQVVGIIITKFRGDRGLFDEGRAMLEAETGVDVLGVLPYTAYGLPEEDSLAYPDTQVGLRGDVDAAAPLEIAVPRLPRMANTTDLDPLWTTPGVVLRFVPPDAGLGDPDAVVLPGSKNTIDDMRDLETGGLAAQLRRYEGPMVGLCGGYQLLGERLDDPGHESPSGPRVVRGLGKLPVETRFTAEKTVAPVTWHYAGGTILGAETASVDGYVIHRGRTHATAAVTTPFTDADTDPSALGAAVGNVAGTYLHGLFENGAIHTAFLDHLFATADVPAPTHTSRPSVDDAISSVASQLADAAIGPQLGISGCGDV